MNEFVSDHHTKNLYPTKEMSDAQLEIISEEEGMKVITVVLFLEKRKLFDADDENKKKHLYIDYNKD